MPVLRVTDSSPQEREAILVHGFSTTTPGLRDLLDMTTAHVPQVRAIILPRYFLGHNITVDRRSPGVGGSVVGEMPVPVSLGT